MNFEEIYNCSPLFIQNLIISIKGYQVQNRRYNRQFYHYLDKFCSNNPDELDMTQLLKFLKSAQKTEFWRNQFLIYNVNIEAENLLQELKKLPILEKETAHQKSSEFHNKFLSEDSFEVSTSGTTGKKLLFHQTRSMENKQWAIWWRYRKRFGLEITDWMGWFGGKIIVPKDQIEPPFWRVNRFGKQVMFSPIHLNRKTAINYYNEIQRRKLKWLHGYPSQIAALASFFLDHNLPPLNCVKIITTGAEGLMDYQKQIIYEAFKIQPVEHYGLSEGVANISQLPDGSYSIDNDFSLVEFIPLNQDTHQKYYRIIGTNYSNLAFPLIRYNTGDIAEVEWIDGKAKVISIEGRSDDYITLGNGNRFGPMNQIFKKFNNVKEAQIFYPEINNIQVRIVKGKGFDFTLDEIRVKKAVEERLTDPDAKYEIYYLEQLPRTKAGKIKSVVKE